MSRASDRAAVVTALADLGTFQSVIGGWPRRLAGITPIAFVVGAGTDVTQRARNAWTLEPLLWVYVLVRNAPTDDPTAAEDAFDACVAATLAAVQALGFLVDRTNTEPYNTPLVEMDGVDYRVERIPIRRPPGA